MNEIIDEFETVCFGDERVNVRAKKLSKACMKELERVLVHLLEEGVK